jgi:hypothetical protein
MDKDDVFDEIVGSLLFDLKQIIEDSKKLKDTGKTPPFIWKNVYGSPVSKSIIST